MSEHRPYRLGLDLGTNSLGWFMVWLERDDNGWRPIGLGLGGVRVFPNGRMEPLNVSSEPSAKTRRLARGMRKRRDRFVNRRKSLMDALILYGLMPTNAGERKALEILDPYRLRADALTRPLPAAHVGRAIFHLNQRRGFLSNRKAEKKDDNKGAIREGADKLTDAIKQTGADSLGQFLWRRHAFTGDAEARQNAIRAELKRLGKDHLAGNKRKKAWAKVRKRLFPDDIIDEQPQEVRARGTLSGTKMTYNFYPTRALLLDEFNQIWKAQAPHHSSMTQDAHQEIKHLIFDQRPLKPAVVGKCSLDPAIRPFNEEPEGYRAPWAHPLAQRFRIFKEARNLEIREAGKRGRKLTKDESDAVALALLQNKEVKFDRLRTLLKLPSETRFNLESERRTALDGDETAARLSDRKRFGKAWRSLPLDQQIAIVEKLIDEQDEDKLTTWIESKCGVDGETAKRIANAPLPEGHCRLGLRALKKVLPIMEQQRAADGRSGIGEYEAARLAGYDPTKQPTGELLDRLPYYGAWLSDDVVGSADPRDGNERRFGRFPNPTVHIGLGQLRRVINVMIKQFGPPAQIVIELARDLKTSAAEKKEIEQVQTKNQKKNEERKAKLLEIGITDPTGTDLLKMRLWEELGDLVKLCPFSGKPISINQLMSSEVEIEHLIPFADSLDNRPANKTVCFTKYNRLKGKMTPYEAFRSSKEWPEISARAATLPKNKRWRFAPDAREQLNKNGRDFLDRQLMETRWLSRLARQYLIAVCDPRQVWVVTGQHTGLIRGKWGLNTLLRDHNFTTAKNRADHRHHAIDAFVATMTDRSLLQRIASVYDDERDKIEVPLPWEAVREDLHAALVKMIVSHKPDHGAQGKFHEEMAYGFVEDEEHDEKGKSLGNLVYRKPLKSLTENEIKKIRDRPLRDMLCRHVEAQLKKGISLPQALINFNEAVYKDPHIRHGVRHVRILKAEKREFLVTIKDDKTSVEYKAYSAGKNLFVEIFELPDGSWKGEAATFFQANQPEHSLKWMQQFPGSRLIMRVYKDDLLRIDHDGETKIVRVVRLEPSANRVRLAPHYEAGVLQDRHEEPDDPFRWIFGQYDRLKEWNAIPVRVDELGRVWRIHPNS